MDYFLTSERLGFRHWTADDEALAIGLWCDPQVTALIGGPWIREQALARLAQEIELNREHGVQYWPVFSLDDGRHVGCAGLRPYLPDEQIYEMGIHLRPAFWSAGFAREAAHAVIDYAFGKVGAEALFAGHHPQNEGSRRLLEKLAFVYQRDQLYAPTGLMHPTYLVCKNKDSNSADHPAQKSLAPLAGSQWVRSDAKD
jgi:ribosomal-protein-alanine N-acetyltransferase